MDGVGVEHGRSNSSTRLTTDGGAGWNGASFLNYLVSERALEFFCSAALLMGGVV